MDNAYKQIQAAIKRIYERSVRTEDSNRVTEFRWVSSRTYFKNEGRFRIAMTNEVMPYLTQLKDNSRSTNLGTFQVLIVFTLSVFMSLLHNTALSVIVKSRLKI